MSKLIVSAWVGLSALTLLTGCVYAPFKDSTPDNQACTAKKTCPTLGQQLLDLKKAKDAGAISDAEYSAEKTKLLNAKSQ
jgi:hypothetical protein